VGSVPSVRSAVQVSFGVAPDKELQPLAGEGAASALTLALSHRERGGVRVSTNHES
jgi:hypothetical protein